MNKLEFEQIEIDTPIVDSKGFLGLPCKIDVNGTIHYHRKIYSESEKTYKIEQWQEHYSKILILKDFNRKCIFNRMKKRERNRF